MRFAYSLLVATTLAAQAANALPDVDYRTIPGAEFQTVLPLVEGNQTVQVNTFMLANRPVTNGEFLAFVVRHPEWRRGEARRLFVDERYLAHWQSALTLGERSAEDAPVTHVSWFAATAYCEAQNGRLPTWHEWELAAAANAVRTDARDDPAWRQTRLDWYAQPTPEKFPPVMQNPANVYGIYDLHGLAWEWVEDFNGMLVTSDNREPGSLDKLEFCGAGALSLEQKENYAVLMRVAFLSSLKAAYTTRNLGFRCARDVESKQ
ncbi:MAG TPA: formylglycine-generating enzyme family protein [Gammaproteobacteria bacterium]